MKLFYAITIVALGLSVGCASQEQVEQQNELVREHQSPEDRAARQQEVQLERQLHTNPEPWR